MSKEIKTYFSEAMLKDKPKKKLGLIINDGAVTTNKLRDNSVTTFKIVDRAVTEPKLADNSVSERTIQMNAVSHDKLAIDVVDKENIRDNAVTTRAIDKQAVTNDKLSVGAVDSENILADAIKEEHIAAGAVSTDEIQDGCITFEKLSPDLMKRLLEHVTSIKVEGQVVFMHNYTGSELPEPKSAGLYAYSDNSLYKSDGVGTYTWNRSASETGKIYVDEDIAQSYISDGHGNLLRLDKENSDLSFEVVG